MNLKDIGSFIAKERKELQLTQKILAEQLHVTPQAVSKWETGRSLPDPALMPELCRILNISIADLLSAQRLTPETYQERTDQTMKNLIIPQKHFTAIRVAAALLLAIGIAIFFYPFGLDGQAISGLAKIGFHAMGAFIWLLALIIQIQVGRAAFK